MCKFPYLCYNNSMVMASFLTSKIKKAFTLAEVLITLVIIGVIAALTIPNVVNNYSKQETVSRLKKAYSTLMQTTARAVVDHGSVDNWELGVAGSADDTLTFFNTYMAPYLSLAEKAQKLSSTSWNKTYYYLNNSEHQYGNWVRTYLADGSSLTMMINTSNDIQKWFKVHVDINGDKKPNKFGRDIFIFWYFIRYDHIEYQGTFQPCGIVFSRNANLSDGDGNCHKNQSGDRCSSVIIKDSWQIKDDYPW